MKKIRALEELANLEKAKSGKKSIHTEDSMEKSWEEYRKSSASRSRYSKSDCRSKSNTSRYIKNTYRIDSKSSSSLERIPKVSSIHHMKRPSPLNNKPKFFDKSNTNNNSHNNTSVDSSCIKHNNHNRNKTPVITKNQEEKKTAIKQAVCYNDNKNS